MKRAALLTATLAIALLAATSIILAQPLAPSVPNLIDFQGKLTTPAGNPVVNGVHTLTFRIYDAPGGGTLLWTEGPLGISTTGGLFTHQLGSSVTLPIDLFSDNNPIWLEVEADGAIITPRTQLISNPYSRVANALEAEPPGLPGTTTVRAPVPGSLCQLSTYSADATEAVRLWGCVYGEIFLFDSDPTNDINAILSAPSSGGFLSLRGGPSAIFLNAGSTGDASASLPTDAINADEMLNEPGIAHEFNVPNITLTTTVTAYDTVSITAPTSGFVVVIAHTQVNLAHTTGTTEDVIISISTIAGGEDLNNAAVSRLPAALPTYAGVGIAELTCTKVQAVAAGTQTYYLNARYVGVGGNQILRRHMTAMFFSTNYGTVVSTKPVVSRVGEAVAASTDAVGTGQTGEVQVITVEDSKAQLEAERAKQMAELEARLKKLEEAAKQQVVDDNR